MLDARIDLSMIVNATYLIGGDNEMDEALLKEKLSDLLRSAVECAVDDGLLTGDPPASLLWLRMTTYDGYAQVAPRLNIPIGHTTEYDFEDAGEGE